MTPTDSPSIYQVLALLSSKGRLISQVLDPTKVGPIAFGMPPSSMAPVRAGGFVGSVNEGGACNCETLTIIPHCHGTHTECIGHVLPRTEIGPFISSIEFPLLIPALLLSITPETFGEDQIIGKDAFEDIELPKGGALIVRTLPNSDAKKVKQWSNPAYFTPEALEFLNTSGVQHLLVDLPSVDREDDGGALAAHKAWWGLPDNPRLSATITELIFITDDIADGTYWVNISPSPLASDAAPSLIKLFPKE
jgi:kynurenine formamidase